MMDVVWSNSSLAGYVKQGHSWSETPLQGAERVTVKYKGEEYVLLGFRTPGRNDADAEQSCKEPSNTHLFPL